MVAVDVNLDPLTAYRHRGSTTDVQCAAGERFRRDFKAAGLQGLQAVDWTRMWVDGGWQPMGRLAAADALRGALRALPPLLSSLAVTVCCLGHGVTEIETRMGWRLMEQQGRNLSLLRFGLVPKLHRRWRRLYRPNRFNDGCGAYAY